MLTILEIFFTAKAWSNGWRWRALLPMGIGFVLAFSAGAAIGASGRSVEGFLPFGILLELVVLGSLIAMVARSPQVRRPAVSSPQRIFSNAASDPTSK